MSWAFLTGAARRVWQWIEAGVRRAAALPRLFRAVKEVEPELTYAEFEKAAEEVSFQEALRRELETRYELPYLVRPEEEAAWARAWLEWSEEQKRWALEARVVERGAEEPKRVFETIPDDFCRKVRHLRPGYYSVVLRYKIKDIITGEESEGYWGARLFGAPSLRRAISQMLSSMEACESPPCLENKILVSASLFDCLRG